MTSFLFSEIMAAFFVSLLIYWVIFKTWQKFHEGRGGASSEGVLMRSLVAGFNAGILGEIGFAPARNFGLAVAANVVFWLVIGLLYGLYCQKKPPGKRPKATDHLCCFPS